MAWGRSSLSPLWPRVGVSKVSLETVAVSEEAVGDRGEHLSDRGACVSNEAVGDDSREHLQDRGPRAVFDMYSESW